MTTPLQRDDFDVRPGSHYTITALFKPISMMIEFDVVGKRNGWIGPPKVHHVSNLSGYVEAEIIDEATRRAMAQAQHMFARA